MPYCRAVHLDGILGLGPRAAAMCTIRVAGEFNDISFLQPQDFLKPSANVLQNLLALGWCTTVLFAWDALAHSPSPQTDTIEALAHIDNNSHNLIVAIIFKRLANGRELCVQP